MPMDKESLLQIKELMEEVFERKFNEAFDAAFDRRFKPAFDEAFARSFDKAFEKSFNAAFDRKFSEAFDEAFDRSFDVAFDRSFDKAFDKSFDAAFDRKFDQKIAPILARLDAIESHLSNLTIQFHDFTESVEERFNVIEDRLDTIEGTLYEHGNKFIRFFHTASDLITDVADHGKRLMTLERTVKL